MILVIIAVALIVALVSWALATKSAQGALGRDQGLCIDARQSPAWMDFFPIDTRSGAVKTSSEGMQYVERIPPGIFNRKKRQAEPLVKNDYTWTRIPENRRATHPLFRRPVLIIGYSNLSPDKLDLPLALRRANVIDDSLHEEEIRTARLTHLRNEDQEQRIKEAKGWKEATAPPPMKKSTGGNR